MHIEKIHIRNFKCFKEVTFEFDPHFNLIIGGNNAGKSTMMESLRLWQLAFNKFLKDRTNNQESSFRSSQYFSFTIDDLTFLRIKDFSKLFFPKSLKIEINVSLKDEEGNKTDLPIFFTLTTEKLNLRFELCLNSVKRKEASDDLLKILGKPKGSSLKDTMLITYINPIFHLPIKETLFCRGYIVEKLHQAKVSEVIRNLIHIYAPLDHKTKAKQIVDKSQKIIDLEKQLHHIVKNEKMEDIVDTFLTFTSNFKQDEDSSIEILALDRELNSKVELSQLGSGTINLLNILSVIAYGDAEDFCLNVLLLDEPDSHLHANHQKRLFDYLIRTAKNSNNQMFVITHNHELIESSEQVLYIDKAKPKSTIKNIPKSEYYKIYKEIAIDYHETMIELANKKDIEVQLESITTPIIYTEGTTDITILKEAYSKLYSQEFFDNKVKIVPADNAASGVAYYVKYSNDKLVTIGILDSDTAGYGQINSLKKNSKFSVYKDKESVISKGNSYCIALPIPDFRKDVACWFEQNTCIEYLFPDDALKKMNIELEIQKGNTYQTIKNIDSQKTTIQEEVSKLVKDDFESFRPLFEVIAEIIMFKLPNE